MWLDQGLTFVHFQPYRQTTSFARQNMRQAHHLAAKSISASFSGNVFVNKSTYKYSSYFSRVLLACNYIHLADLKRMRFCQINKHFLARILKRNFYTFYARASLLKNAFFFTQRLMSILYRIVMDA